MAVLRRSGRPCCPAGLRLPFGIRHSQQQRRHFQPCPPQTKPWPWLTEQNRQSSCSWLPVGSPLVAKVRPCRSKISTAASASSAIGQAPHKMRNYAKFHSTKMFLPRPSMSGLLPLVPGRAHKSRRSLVLLAATLLYLVAGALLFSQFELDEELRARREVAVQRRAMQRKYGFSEKDFALLEQVVVQSVPLAAGPQWQLLGSLYFCTVMITTIGYGHSTPYTVAGRLFSMLYALGGIPLGLVTFQSVGERINHCAKAVLQRMDRRWQRRRMSSIILGMASGSNKNIAHADPKKLLAAAGTSGGGGGHHQIKSRHLLAVSFAIGCITIAVATGVFHQRERWSIFDSAYYCMITLSTIGFGDFVPAQTNNRLAEEPGYVLFTLFFILFGLATFSACINLLILECMSANADIVTARTRLKRMISVRMSTSFRIVTGQQNGMGGGGSAAPKIRRARAIRRRAGGQPPPMATRKAGVVVEKIGHHHHHDDEHRWRRRKSRAASLAMLQEIYGRYYWPKPAEFRVRRLPTPYIEHLVNVRGSCHVGVEDVEKCGSREDFVDIL